MAEYTFKQTENKNNKNTYEVVVNYSYYQILEDKVFSEEAKKIKMPGFRPGKAPKELIEKDISSKVFTNAINKLLPEIAFEILTQENLNPLANLDYSLKEFDKDKGVIFTFTLFTQPVIDIKKLETIKIFITENEVKEEEIDDVIRNMLKQKEKSKKKEEDKIDEAELVGEDNNDSHKDQLEPLAVNIEDNKNKKGEIQAEITDEEIKTLGYEDANTYSELKEKIRESLLKFKEQQSNNELSQKAIEEALKVIQFDLPDEMVKNETIKQEEEFRNRLNKIKLNEEGYLKTQGTTIEKLREEWEKESRSQISTDLMLINIAIQEKIVPTEEDVDNEIKSIKDQKIKMQYQNVKNRDYLRTLMTRDRGLSKLMQIVKK